MINNVPNIKKISSSIMIPIIQEILENGKNATLTVTGKSMLPFLREDMDRVVLKKCSFQKVKRGDIVLLRRTSGEYVLHRIIHKKVNNFYVNGDAQDWIEGPLYPDQLLASVVAIYRGKYLIKCSNILWTTIVKSWMFFFPFRKLILIVLRKLKRIKNRF